MIRPLLSLERLSFHEKEGKDQVTIRYYGLYANAHRGKIKKGSLEAFPLRIIEDKLQRIPSRGWAALTQ